MTTPTRPATKPETAPADAKKSKGPRKKITFFEAIRRVEIAMRDLTPQQCLKLVEYASTHAEGLQQKPATGEQASP